MTDFSDLPLATRVFLAAYRWRRIDPVPWAPLRKPLAECTAGLVSTAGLVPPEQPPFDDDVKGGDSSFRLLDSNVDLATLVDTHRSKSYDHAGIHADANLAFPLTRLRELASEGVIGSVSPRQLSFMGSITATSRLVRETAPAAAEEFVRDGVDVALLVPV